MEDFPDKWSGDLNATNLGDVISRLKSLLGKGPYTLFRCDQDRWTRPLITNKVLLSGITEDQPTKSIAISDSCGIRFIPFHANHLKNTRFEIGEDFATFRFFGNGLKEISITFVSHS